ncbi:putative Zn-dependent hydrolases of the beta-lactamase protein [Desarmillaria tabescens]|uniref:Zn-dependent hydrolases of the beta-lactamase protein n=1 Tax=Armillaria tabescens TaxID=1929756 RepID=A0AA39K8X8_ARMTA|nr:putative Zn-dependent hydrolases of the beta-lactamase protein [Desarmillaria tabescens]KAK0455610.1 putative Zn-dependent hydrolases of the beta-lactamase protein [Desarmillaria tabescens]
MSLDFKSSLNITHIGTVTAIFEIDGVNLLTDPFFSPAGTEWDVSVVVIKNSDTPALGLHDLPPIEGVFLSHEDHPDNLDELGRRLLDGRKVITTMDGTKQLHPRPGVRGIRPWETVLLEVGGKGECTGFILTAPEFGSTDGLPNAIYFSGDTVYIEELAEMCNKFHIVVAVLNLGAAKAPLPDGPLQITMDGKQAARLFREIKADILVPMHYESWNHFTQFGKELAKVFEEEGIQDKVCWLTPGVSKKVI